jgi:uncharacterized protein (TIGR02117 family)
MGKTIIKAIAWIMATPIIMVCAYFSAALIGGILGEGGATRSGPPAIDVYVRTNGVHADLVLPMTALDIDWRQRLPFTESDPALNYLAFGWGDREFYLTTPSWADLRATTALKALSGFDESVMHVEAAPPPSPFASRHPIAELHISEQQYRQLVAFVEGSFRRDASGTAILIEGARYNAHDAFFEAKGHYSAINTCNEWTRQALHHADLRTPLWTPFDIALMHQMRT